MKKITTLFKSLFNQTEVTGTPLDMTPGIKVSKVIIPEHRTPFNEVFLNVKH